MTDCKNLEKIMIPVISCGTADFNISFNQNAKTQRLRIYYGTPCEESLLHTFEGNAKTIPPFQWKNTLQAPRVLTLVGEYKDGDWKPNCWTVVSWDREKIEMNWEDVGQTPADINLTITRSI